MTITPSAVANHVVETLLLRSRDLAEGNRQMSSHEFAAAAIINGRIELLDGDFRRALIYMGREYADGVVAAIFELWTREQTLAAADPDCPIGEQRIFGCIVSNEH